MSEQHTPTPGSAWLPPRRTVRPAPAGRPSTRASVARGAAARRRTDLQVRGQAQGAASAGAQAEAVHHVGLDARVDRGLLAHLGLDVRAGLRAAAARARDGPRHPAAARGRRGQRPAVHPVPRRRRRRQVAGRNAAGRGALGLAGRCSCRSAPPRCSRRAGTDNDFGSRWPSRFSNLSTCCPSCARGSRFPAMRRGCGRRCPVSSCAAWPPNPILLRFPVRGPETGAARERAGRATTRATNTPCPAPRLSRAGYLALVCARGLMDLTFVERSPTTPGRPRAQR